MTISLRLPDGTLVSTERTPALVGRALEADLRIPEWQSSVSRSHARIHESGGRYYIEDLGSSNGTKVDGIRIGGPTPLTLSCRLGLGDVETFLTLTSLPAPAPGTVGLRTMVVPQPGAPAAPQPYVPVQPPYQPPAAPYVAGPPPQQPPAPYVPRLPQPAPVAAPLRPRLVSSSSPDDPRQLNLHRYLAWGAVGLMLLSFSMPWVKALIFQLSYFGMLKELTKASDAAGEFGLELQTTAVFLPLLALVLALAAGALNHALPLKQGALLSAIAGGVGLLTAFGVYSYASTGFAVDVSGALTNGYYLFCLASAGLLAEGLAMRLVVAPKSA